MDLKLVAIYIRVLSMFSSRSFMISSLTVGALEFIFIYGIRECSDFIVFHVSLSSFPTTLTEETVFSPLNFLPSLS